MGKKWLFVCSNSGYKACHDKIEASFGDRDDYRRYEIFSGISSNGEVNRMRQIIREDGIETVVAVEAAVLLTQPKLLLSMRKNILSLLLPSLQPMLPVPVFP